MISEFRKKIIIQTTIFLGVVGITGGLIFYISGNIKKLQGQITLERSDVAFRSRALSNLNELRRDEPVATRYLSPLKNALPSKVGLFVFQDEIKKMARDEGLSAELRFIGEEEGGVAASKARFALDVNGDYQRIRRFIANLEASRYFTIFEQFEILSQGGVASSYQIKINGAVFFK